MIAKNGGVSDPTGIESGHGIVNPSISIENLTVLVNANNL
jgi:hypothetical protein